MDTFSGYNQIQMDHEDEYKITFVTKKGLYCYKVMSFGLKNTEETYQWLIKKVFEKHLGRNMKVYVDDMLVKTVQTVDHVKYLNEAFDA